MKRISVMCSSQMDSEEVIGRVDELPSERLFEGVKPYGLKDLVGREDEIFYTLRRKLGRHWDDKGNSVREEWYYLEPIRIESVRVDEPDGRWVKYTEYSVRAVSLSDGKDRYFSNKGAFSTNSFYSEEGAQKLRDNATKLLEEKDYVEKRATEVDENLAKEVLHSIDNTSKIVQTDLFPDGKAKVSIGTTGGFGNAPEVVVFIHISPVKGKFFDSSLYEVAYLPMTDGVVYRSYGAFGRASSKQDWFLGGKNVKELTVDEMWNEIDALIDIYNNIEDGFDDSKLGKQVHSIFK